MQEAEKAKAKEASAAAPAAVAPAADNADEKLLMKSVLGLSQVGQVLGLSLGWSSARPLAGW